MKIFVLIITILHGGFDKLPYNIATQEYTSQSKCEAAGKAFSDKLKSEHPSSKSLVVYSCSER